MRAVLYFFCVFLLFSCGNNEELSNCQKENEKLQLEKAKQDSLMQMVSRTYSKIDSTSIVIARKKAEINELGKKSKLTKSEKELILAKMDTINQLMNENRNRVTTLQGGLSENNQDEGFKFILQSMEDKNENEDLHLTDMKKDLAQVSKDFSDLFEEYIYKEVENNEMKEQLSSAEKELQDAQAKLDLAKEKLQSGWYVIGTKEDLEAKGLIFHKGFFDNKAINEDFDKSQFKKVDIYDLKEVLLDARKAEIVTTHPSESYEKVGIKKKVNKLVIKNPELFWSVSKFLIIEIER